MPDDPIEVIAEEILQQEGISEIFYYLEAFTTLVTGRTVGRKIGVVQEIILRKYLEQEPDLRRGMFFEQALLGKSGATHKVEFSWFARTETPKLLAGNEIPGSTGLRVTSVDGAAGRVRIGGGAVTTPVWIGFDRPTPRSGPLRIHLDAQAIDLRVVSIDGDAAVMDVIDKRRLLASLESKRVGAQRFKGSEKLGSGIQTIEKAKQASLVAVDLDLQYNGTVKPLQVPGEPKQTLSVVALGNGVHWTEKDKSVLSTYVDFTYLVKDASIIRYFEFVRELGGADVEFLEFFMDYFQGMTKQGPDDFEVEDDDFHIIVPEGELRSLREVLVSHMRDAV